MESEKSVEIKNFLVLCVDVPIFDKTDLKVGQKLIIIFFKFTNAIIISSLNSTALRFLCLLIFRLLEDFKLFKCSVISFLRINVIVQNLSYSFRSFKFNLFFEKGST